MNNASLGSLALLTLLAAACTAPTADDAAIGTTEQAITPIPIPDAYNPDFYSITPIPIPSARPIRDAILVDGTGIYYVSQHSFPIAHSAVKLRLDGTLLLEGKSIAGNAPVTQNNLVGFDPGGGLGTLVFGDGTVSSAISLDPLVKPTVRYPKPDPSAPEVHGHGGAILGDGRLVDVFTVRGFAQYSKTGWSPRCGTYDCDQVAADSTPGHRGFWQVADHTLKNVAVGSGYPVVTSSCDVTALGAYANGAPVTSADDETSGRVHVASRLADGRVVECRGPVGSATARLLTLPFKSAGPISFDGGGGINRFDGGGGINHFDGGGGINRGLYVGSLKTPELAYFPPGQATAVALPLTKATSGAAYTGSIARHVVTLGSTAYVVTMDGRVLVITH